MKYLLVFVLSVFLVLENLIVVNAQDRKLDTHTLEMIFFYINGDAQLVFKDLKNRIG
jgi:hypothetical protein